MLVYQYLMLGSQQYTIVPAYPGEILQSSETIIIEERFICCLYTEVLSPFFLSVHYKARH